MAKSWLWGVFQHELGRRKAEARTEQSLDAEDAQHPSEESEPSPSGEEGSRSEPVSCKEQPAPIRDARLIDVRRSAGDVMVNLGWSVCR